MIIVIGISGKKGSGKDEVFKRIQHHFPLAQRIAFADSLKEEVARALCKTTKWVEEHKTECRTILQWWGTDYRRAFNGQDYWIEQWLRKCKESTAPVIVAPDVRFENEANTIHEIGGHVWRVNRNNLTTTDIHPSECALDVYNKFDRTIDNDWTIERLGLEVDLALEMSGLL